MRAATKIAIAVAGVVLAIAATALARSRTTIHSRVDLVTETITSIPSPTLTPTKLTTPRAAAALVATYDRNGRVFVRTAQGQDKLALTVGKHAHEWMPWSILQPGVLVFDWRERVVASGTPETSRDVLRGVDLATGAELWRRDTTGAYAAPLGGRLLLLRTEKDFELVDSRTGRVVRTLALPGGGPSSLPIDGGDTLVDTGEILARLDDSGAIVWQIPDRGAILSITPLAQPTTRYHADLRERSAPLPATGDVLILGSSHIERLDLATGTVVWTRPSTSTSLLVDGARVLTTDIARDPATRAATLTLVNRNVSDGVEVRELELFRYREFFDSARAVLIAVHGDLVEVTTELIVLD